MSRYSLPETRASEVVPLALANPTVAAGVSLSVMKSVAVAGVSGP